MQRGTVLIRVYVESRDELVKLQAQPRYQRPDSWRFASARRGGSIASVLELVLAAHAEAAGAVNNRRSSRSRR